jgi:hypothetical protein
VAARASGRDVRDRRIERLVEQLDRGLQQRQRRAQLVRGGRQEGLPGGLLVQQAATHRLQGASEIADLVVSGVDRQRLGDAGVSEAPGRLAQALEAPQEPVAEQDAEQQRDGQPGSGRERQRPAHDGGCGAAVAERLAQHERERPAASAHRSDDDRLPAENAQAHVPRAGEPGARARGARIGRATDGIGVHHDATGGVEQCDAAASAPLEVPDDPRRPRRARPQLVCGQPAQRQTRRAGQHAHGAQAVDREAVLQRRQQRGDDHGQGRRAGGHQGEHELPAPGVAHAAHASGASR